MNHCKRPCVEATLSRLFLITGMGGRKGTLKKTLKCFKIALKALRGPSRRPRPLRIPSRALWALICLKGLIWPGGQMNHCKKPCVEATLYSMFLYYRTLKRHIEMALKSFKQALKASKEPSRLPEPLRIPLRALWALIGLKGLIWFGGQMIHCKRSCTAAKLYSFVSVYWNVGRKRRHLEKNLKGFQRALKALKGPSRLPGPLRIPLRALWALIGLKGFIWPGGQMNHCKRLCAEAKL